MMNLDDVKRVYSINSVLGVRGRKLICPFPDHIHRNYTPSFSIYTHKDGHQWFVCHGSCGRKGDVIDLVGYLEIPEYDPKSLPQRIMAMHRLRGDHEVSIPEPPPSILKLKPGQWKDYLPPSEEAVGYAVSRGIPEDLIDTFQLGSIGDTWLTIPSLEDDILKGIKCRRISGRGGRYWFIEGSVASLFNYNAINLGEAPVLIVKGEIACMVCVSKGFSACSSTGGEGQHLDMYLPALSLSKKRIVVGDNGNDEIHALAERRAMELNAELRFPPAEHVGIDDWILSDEDAVEVIRGWI